jgi:HD-GYP domain-containing protein (c-di-GMP phosphodiesterase class II)
MEKKINVDQLVIGMYLKQFCGSWMDHPFWRSGFVIQSQKEIDAVQASPIKEVWIDSSKGLDCVSDGSSQRDNVSQPPAAAPVESREGADVPLSPPVVNRRVAMSVEVHRAAQICAQAKDAVVSMFNEARMGNSVDAEGVNKLVMEISDSVMRNANALISLARLKTADDYTYMHSVAVCAMMVALGRQLGFVEEQARVAGVAGLMHDLGKAMMPMEVLNKPGKLTDDEFAIIKRHPREGHRLLLQSDSVDAVVLDVCLHHHEKVDGSGYPDRLSGDAISIYAKMGAVCDVYDAITSNRPYKAGWDPSESLRNMAKWSKNGHFDVEVFQAFVKCLGIYPVGSLVRLSSGRIGVVVDQTEKLVTPCVKVFYSIKAGMRIPPELVDLSQPDATEKIEAREDPAKWHFPDLNELWSGLDIMPV